MPAATAIIHDAAGRVLMVYSIDQYWSTPGGALDPGETAAEGVVREIQEELGITVEPERVLAVHRTEVFYPNGDHVDYTSIAFRCRIVAGELHSPDGEVVEWEWVEPAEAVSRGVTIPEPALHADYDGPVTF